MKYERLTPEILLSDVVKGYNLRDDILSKTFGGYNVIELIDRLVELENKIEAGVLVEIPKSAMASTPEEKTVRVFAEKLRDEEFCVKIGSKWVPVVKSQNIDKFIKEMYEV